MKPSTEPEGQTDIIVQIRSMGLLTSQINIGFPQENHTTKTCWYDQLTYAADTPSVPIGTLEHRAFSRNPRIGLESER